MKDTRQYIVIAPTYQRAVRYVPQIRYDKQYYYVCKSEALRGWEMGENTIVIYCPGWRERNNMGELQEQILLRGFKQTHIFEGEEWQDK